MAAKVISFRLTVSTIEMLDKASQRAHLSRTAVLEYGINLFVRAIENGSIERSKGHNFEDYIRNRVIEAFSQQL